MRIRIVASGSIRVDAVARPSSLPSARKSGSFGSCRIASGILRRHRSGLAAVARAAGPAVAAEGLALEQVTASVAGTWWRRPLIGCSRGDQHANRSNNEPREHSHGNQHRTKAIVSGHVGPQRPDGTAVRPRTRELDRLSRDRATRNRRSAGPLGGRARRKGSRRQTFVCCVAKADRDGRSWPGRSCPGRSRDAGSCCTSSRVEAARSWRQLESLLDHMGAGDGGRS